ncbi:ligase-associated DNA damage response endonuclease PdeM [Desertivirga xinjiangensis]|uniref:ligase-associated DNA damage response endonuclease PdeM n=1 Tax=Desertivirga xinjiangensis TaxID=539206 RepID=UPI00210A9A37|nr:ligase-associated DNA damage response endonuclease PdeM [Pedobacter xinjiangensis]
MWATKSLEWEFKGQHLVFLPQKAMFWKEERTLVVADLHIGKVGHFRKAGIAIPKLMEQEELSVLSDLVHEHKPQRIIFLGDLFHSDHNNDWNWLVLWREQFPAIEMVLVKGNHDILHESYYAEAGFVIFETFATCTFLFVHEPLKSASLINEKKYVISGHIHPGVKLRGLGRQSLTVSCFYFGEKQAVLPAFGKFTGNFCVEAEKSSRVFGVLSEKVVLL